MRKLNRLGKILRLLRIVQVDAGMKTYPDEVYDRVTVARLHPCNPISYIIVMVVVTVAFALVIWDRICNIISFIKDEFFNYREV